LEWTLIVVFEAIYAVIATILILLSFMTLRAISHLGIGKQFWIPVIASSIFFLIGSLVTIFYELGFSIIVQTVEIVQIFRIAALCVWVVGIYSYSRRVKASLVEEFSIPPQSVEEQLEAEIPLEKTQHIDPSSQQKRVREDTLPERKKIAAAPACKHHFGYLQTLPRNASVPDDCLRCTRIIACKHSLATTLESHVRG
jgi:Ca2+/Na+ antiporter